MPLAASLVMIAVPAMADFSSTTTVKPAGGAPGTVTKQKVKGNKMKVDTGDVTILTDLDTQTMTTIQHRDKTYKVTPLSQIGEALKKAGGELKADIKETGQQKKIGGFNCRQVIMNMTVQSAQMSMVMENEMWISSEVPGVAEMQALSARMAERGIVPTNSDPQMRRMVAGIQSQMSKLKGVPVLQITRMKPADDAKAKQMQDQMSAARAQLEAMKKQGGAQAEMANKALANMPAPGGRYMMEVTMESSGFSTAPIPASEFAIPAGYKKVDR